MNTNTNLWAERTVAEVEEDLYMWLDEDLEEIREDESWMDQYIDLLDEEEFDYDYEGDYED